MRLFASSLAALVAVLAGAPVGTAQSLHGADSPTVALPSDPLAVAREVLAIELAASTSARRLTSPPPGWNAAVRAVERRIGVPWSGPQPVLMQVPDDGSGFPCAPGAESRSRCLGRTEGVRDGDRCVFLFLFASSAMLDRHVWEHELTHAILVQAGRERASRAHDPRYFE